MFVKGCACCGTLYDQGTWDTLRFLGFQTDDEESLELRQCGCGKMLALKVLVDETTVLSKAVGVLSAYADRLLGSAPLAPPTKPPSTRPRAPDDRSDRTEPCLPASYYWPPMFFVRKGVAHPSA